MSRPGKEVKRGRALEREAFVARRRGDFDHAAVEAAAAAYRHAAAVVPKGVLPKGFPTGDAQRWVPIGPSVVRRGQANDRPRVAGRIRDLAVHTNGRRAYAASGQGGVWYTEDGGATWDPVGGWSEFTAATGGDNNAQSCGAILVDFRDDDPAHDFVMVGTGENTPFRRITGHGRYGGLGVLSALGPVPKGVGANPWEPLKAADLTLFEGLGMFAFARRPGRVAGATTAGSPDQVLAATSGGLFLGTRQVAPPTGEFTWAKLPGIDTLVGGPPTPAVTDVLWIGGRIVVAIDQQGVAFSDDTGTTFNWLNGCSPPGTNIQGFSSLSLVPGTNTLYILTATPPPPPPPPPAAAASDTPALFQVADITVAAPAAVNVNGVPADLWGTQRDYDQAIATERVGGVDRVYLGGSTVWGGEEFVASLYCFDVGAGPALGPATGISRTGAPAPPPPPAPPAGAGDGADTAGLIGNNVHADVHTIRLAGVAGSRHVWVGCDGGVYVSTQNGRVNSFAPRVTGLAVLQPGFVACHPTSSHFVAAGFQDNGTQVRSGDTMWESVLTGDGGGTAFHPGRPQFIVSQATRAAWRSAPATGYVRPTTRTGTNQAHGADRENRAGNALFYSGSTAVATPGEDRIALGTARVWMTDNLGAVAPNRWRVLPWSVAPATAAATDPRQNGNDLAAQQTVGVPTFVAGDVAPSGVGPLGQVVTVKWVTATSVLVLFEFGVVRWDEAPAGQWAATTLLVTGTEPATSAQGGLTFLTDIAPVPGSQDFYVTTTGDPANNALDTLYRFDSAAGAMVALNLRNALVPPGSPAGTVGALEPAYSVVVDQPPGGAPMQVYVGAVTGAWRRQHLAPAATLWTRFVNGLPQASVQDLTIWVDPAGGPRLLRAAVQARGVWEVDLAAANEPQRTYLRVHPRDDRRRLPTPLANPRRAPGAAAELVFESPDVVVRPRAGAGISPRWILGGATINAGNVHNYQLWTFQTAFRWIFPSVIADGRWTDAFGDLVEQHRATLRPTLGAPLLPLGRFVDRRLWDAVVGGTRVDPVTGQPSGNAAHPLAVYRQPWQTASALTAPATEVDLLESVQPREVLGGMWRVHSELSTVDVLLHHRDTRPVPRDQAFAILLWRFAPGSAALLGAPAGDIVAFARDIAQGNAHAVPDGWTHQTGPAPGNAPRHSLPVALDARLPRAVSIDVNLSTVPTGNRVLFLAIAGSSADRCSAAAVGLPANPTVSDLARCWPHAALRMVQVNPRP
ncbi:MULTISPECIES: hypothetical protein [unclassified Nocardioides]|uniref:hypothetical protein n=1 Tax=unclassified Nocardioides TaxID=2615069 RepID=UPI003611313D